jgi:hypothetical protein
VVDGVGVESQAASPAGQPCKETESSLADSCADVVTIFSALVRTTRAPVAMAAAHLAAQGRSIAHGAALRVRPDPDRPLGRIMRPLPC